ncbi:hypothetical protein AB0I85_28555 [Micromonospora echinofusca]|uniref:hypothetical protein n=1 Tax=Micromonospora echinofusca TaxID=47858 RepID=UPI0033E822B5
MPDAAGGHPASAGRLLMLTADQYDALIDAIDLAQSHYGAEADYLAGRPSRVDRAYGRAADRAVWALEEIRRALGDPGRDPDVEIPDFIPDDIA